MEHLRSVKIAIQNLGPNKTEAGITKVGKILRVLVPLLHKFDLENGVSKVSGHHSKPGEDKVIRIILENLSSSLDVIPNREYRSFHNPTNPLHARSSQDIEKWVVGDIKKKEEVNYRNVVCQHKNHSYNTSYLYHNTNTFHSLHVSNCPYH